MVGFADCMGGCGLAMPLQVRQNNGVFFAWDGCALA
jgi:hypothetical protein